MKNRILICLGYFVLLLTTFILAQDDAEGSKDIPYFSRMPNGFISQFDNKEFDAYQFYDGKSLVSIEGKIFQNTYQRKEGATPLSVLQVRRNYTAAIKSAGGTILFDSIYDGFEDTRAGFSVVTGKMTKGDNEVWVEVAPSEDEYTLTIVERQKMVQDVSVQGLMDALNADGHVALYINFDTGKSSVKSESLPIIEQITSLLKSNTALTVSIEGHTDNVGNAKNNKTLSEERAKSVMSLIIKNGIPSTRMSASGWGQEKPIADNATDEGRAKNRRVELVKK
jgi:outer membrane protein OmpA-like peptidoglycan-associated protein